MSTHPVSGRLANWLSAAFYVAVLAIAGTGCALAATDWLGWPLAVALPAVLVLELASVALLTRADYRRRLGERAIAYRLLAGGVGALAVAINWFGHVQGSLLAATFFAGFSALGLVYVFLTSADRRRDQLRSAGTLPPVTPAYGLVQWLRHPALTQRARALALRDPDLGLYGSLAAAAAEVRQEEQRAVIVELIRRKLTVGRDDLEARLLIATHPLDEVARVLEDGSDTAAVAAFVRPVLPVAATADRPAIRAVKAEPIEAEIVPDSAPVSAGRAAPVRRLPDTDARRVAVALKRAEPGITEREAAPLVTRAPRTVREYWATEKTAAQPVVKSGKSATEKAPDDAPRIGFQPPPSTSA
jgi:hypothetical protein